MLRDRIGRAYREVGLLAWLSLAALVFGATLHSFSRLPPSYTWLEPLRTLRLVYEIEHFPTAILATYLVGEVRRRDPAFGEVWRRLREPLGGALAADTWRPLLFGAALAFVDGAIFDKHDAVDVASVLVLGVVIGRRRPDRRASTRLLGHVVIGAVGFACIAYCYTIVKALTFVGRAQTDAALAGFEHAIFGAYPHRVVAAWASTKPAFVQLCDWVYFRFFHHMTLTTVLLAGLRLQKERTEYLGALALCYLIGAPLYHILPAAGPGYYDPESYAYLADNALTTNEIRAWLFNNTMGVVSGQAEVVRTWGYIACMPSLHVAHELVMLYYARRSTVALAVSSVFTAITMIAVVVLGWHYVIDSVGAVIVAGLSIAIARWQRDRLMPAALAPAEDAPLSARPLITWMRDVFARRADERSAADDKTISGEAAARGRAPASIVANRIVGALALGGLAARLVVAVRDLAAVDRLFVPDDAYYTLSIARSLARGLGPSADGVTLTNGFQPLLAFLTVPVFWIARGPEAPFVAVLVISAVADATSIWLLGRIAGRMGGPLAGVVAAGMWALSPLAIANAMNGLETSLALALQLGLVECWATMGGERAGLRRPALAGALAGLALLARVDSIFLVVALGIVAVVRLRRRPAALGAMVGAAGAVVAPWWIYSLVRFGTVVPESGAAVRAGLAIHEQLYLTMSKEVAWMGGSLLGPPTVDLPRLRAFVFDHPGIGMLLCAGVIAGAAAATWALLRRRRREDDAVLAFAIHAFALIAFYCFWVPALWFFRRYLCPVHALTTVLLAAGAGRVFDAASRPAWLRSCSAAALALAVGLGIVGTGRALRGWPLGHELDMGLEGAKGYAPAARDVLALLPDGAVVGAFQSGALAYFAGDRVRVVNLDGVVDGRARRAGEQETLLDYAFERGVTHIADWKFNLENLQRLSKQGQHGMQARGVGRARPQGNDRFAVYAIEWDAPAAHAPSAPATGTTVE